MPRASLALACAVLLPFPAGAQVHYTATVHAGSAFMLDKDAPDPPGSYSLSATIDRRYGDRAVSAGLEAGFHRYVSIRETMILEPKQSGSSSSITQSAGRFTPYLRLATRESTVRVYVQTGLGVYLRKFSSEQRQIQGGVVAFDVSSTTTDTKGGVHFGLGLELFPGLGRFGLGFGLRSHRIINGSAFNTAEIGVVYRAM